ncbi:MAG: HD domain-containing protein [Anaerolineae bacterium]|nr:HD domain-containing protein [Anaerolineae bacterium]
MSDAHHPQKGPFLRSLHPGDQFTGFYILRSKQLEPFRDASRGYFLTLILGDSSGQLLARVWEGGEEANGQLTRGEVVKVHGEVETYLDRVQARVFQIRPASAGEFDHQDMLASSPRSSQDMLAELKSFLSQVTNPHLRALLDTFFTDPAFLSAFSKAPAARSVHHAYLGGLLEHTLEMLAIGSTALQLYPSIDPDLLLTGILLHDIGKVREFTWDLDLDYADEGRLLGHIVIADEMLTKTLLLLPDFPAQLALRLRHMLLAHHGRYQWGSPRRPKTIEGIALHHIENLSAQINRFDQLLKDLPADESWTTYDRMLHRQLYGPPDNDLSIEEQGLSE